MLQTEQVTDKARLHECKTVIIFDEKWLYTQGQKSDVSSKRMLTVVELD